MSMYQLKFDLDTGNIEEEIIEDQAEGESPSLDDSKGDTVL